MVHIICRTYDVVHMNITMRFYLWSKSWFCESSIVASLICSVWTSRSTWRFFLSNLPISFSVSALISLFFVENSDKYYELYQMSHIIPFSRNSAFCCSNFLAVISVLRIWIWFWKMSSEAGKVSNALLDSIKYFLSISLSKIKLK